MSTTGKQKNVSSHIKSHSEKLDMVVPMVFFHYLFSVTSVSSFVYLSTRTLFPSVGFFDIFGMNTILIFGSYMLFLCKTIIFVGEQDE